jgi:hypothetical protein
MNAYISSLRAQRSNPERRRRIGDWKAQPTSWVATVFGLAMTIVEFAR